MEIGCGAGVITQYLSSIASLVVAGDINKRAISKTRATLSNASNTYLVIGDGATYIKLSNIDVFVFNPPYLPSFDVIDFRDLEGGREGIEVTYSFLSQILYRLEIQEKKERRRIYFITSSLSNVGLLKNKIRELCEVNSIDMKWDILSSLDIEGERIEVNRILFI